MYLNRDTDNMLSVLDGYTLETTDDIALKLAEDFRHRRIEKNLTHEEIFDGAVCFTTVSIAQTLSKDSSLSISRNGVSSFQYTL